MNLDRLAWASALLFVAVSVGGCERILGLEDPQPRASDGGSGGGGNGPASSGGAGGTATGGGTGVGGDGGAGASTASGGGQGGSAGAGGSGVPLPTDCTAQIAGEGEVALFDPDARIFHVRKSDGSLKTLDDSAVLPDKPLRPLAGSWTNGLDLLAVYDPADSTFRLRASSSDPSTYSVPFTVGASDAGGDRWPLGGVFSASTAGVGFYDVSEGNFYLRKSADAGNPDAPISFGTVGDNVGIVGAWKGGIVRTAGVFERTASPPQFTFRKTNGAAFACDLPDGVASDWSAVAGAWLDGDVSDYLGLFDPHTKKFYLRLTNEGMATAGDYVCVEAFGTVTGATLLPVAGRFGL